MSSLFPLPSPTLPDFTSLLVSGPIHPSASVHLCLTHLASRPGSNAIFLTPSRDTFLSALIDFNDDWLNECGGYGAVVSVLSRVISLYPPSPAHLALLLSMIKIVESTDDPAHSARIPLDEPPELIVLHELSSYFMDSDGSTHGDLPSYISLIASALSAASTFDPPVPLVLIDSRLETLQLPLIRSFSSDSVNSDANRPRPVTSVIEHFFEWKAVVNVTAKAEDDAPGSRIGKSLSLRKLRDARANEDEGGTVWEWEEADGEVRGSAGRAGRVFIWP